MPIVRLRHLALPPASHPHTDRLSLNAGQLGERIVAAADTVGSAIKNPFKAVTNSVRAFPHNLVRGVKDVGEGVKEVKVRLSDLHPFLC